MRVTALSRGGLAVHGGLYDPHANEAVVHARENETVALIIEYPSAPTSPSKAENGVSCSTPAVSGNKITATLSSMRDGGYVDMAATVGGVSRKIRIRAKTDVSADAYER